MDKENEQKTLFYCRYSSDYMKKEFDELRPIVFDHKEEKYRFGLQVFKDGTVLEYPYETHNGNDLKTGKRKYINDKIKNNKENIIFNDVLAISYNPLTQIIFVIYPGNITKSYSYDFKPITKKFITAVRNKKVLEVIKEFNHQEEGALEEVGLLDKKEYYQSDGISITNKKPLSVKILERCKLIKKHFYNNTKNKSR